MSSISHKSFLAIAVPFTISTVTQPLLGAVDTAVVGRLESATYIGGVAIGTVIFNTLYWLFGFLRVSTSGFSSQSLGTNNEEDRYYAYLRPLAVAVIISILFVAFQYPIIRGAMAIYKPDPDVARHAMTYFNILIWGAPLVLIGYVNLGWLMGRKLVKETLFLQVSTNVMNIILDVLFVMVFKMDVAGVAWATLISQTYGFSLGIFFISRQMSSRQINQFKARIFDSKAIKKIMAVNSDLLVRTACLLIMTNMFIAKGSALGATVLAANAILFQLQYIVAYFFDGFANACSVFVGEAVGENNLKKFNRTVSISNIHVAWMSLTASLILILLKNPIIVCFTDITEVITLCHAYFIWLTLFPLIMGIGLVYYGLYTGATYTAPVRNSLIVALGVFVAVYFTAIPLFDNHGLWLAFLMFCLCRSAVLIIYKNKLIQSVFTQVPPENGQRVLP
ncbi:MAG: MATE family efflux transporter [Desulfobacterales bacterium]|nr:MATE family efflux transporter [Desulfobacterales bacterium]